VTTQRARQDGTSGRPCVCVHNVQDKTPHPADHVCVHNVQDKTAHPADHVCVHNVQDKTPHPADHVCSQRTRQDGTSGRPCMCSQRARQDATSGRPCVCSQRARQDGTSGRPCVCSPVCQHLPTRESRTDCHDIWHERYAIGGYPNVYFLNSQLSTNSTKQSSSFQANRSSTCQESPAFYGTQICITAFTKARLLSLSWARSIQTRPSKPIFRIHFNIIHT
jgi:hypothetical protein